MVRPDDERPFDWLLDFVAPLYGCIIGLSIAYAVLEAMGCP